MLTPTLAPSFLGLFCFWQVHADLCSSPRLVAGLLFPAPCLQGRCCSQQCPTSYFVFLPQVKSAPSGSRAGPCHLPTLESHRATDFEQWWHPQATVSLMGSVPRSVCVPRGVSCLWSISSVEVDGFGIWVQLTVLSGERICPALSSVSLR